MHQLLFVFVFYSNFFLLSYCFVQGAKRRTKPPSSATSTPLRLPYLLLEECSRELTMSWFMEVRTYYLSNQTTCFYCSIFLYTLSTHISQNHIIYFCNARCGVLYHQAARPPLHHQGDDGVLPVEQPRHWGGICGNYMLHL